MRPRSPRSLLPVFIGLTLTACVETDPPDEQGPLLLPDSSADARLEDTAPPAADAMATVDATAVDAIAVDATAHEDLDPPDADRPVEPPPAPFGAACTRPSDCTPAALRWPACLEDACPPEDCTYPGLADAYGYCTRDCTRDEQCEGAIDGPYGTEFSCLTDGTRGTCVPGSGAACVLRGGQQCEAPDEVCRFGRIYTPDRDYGGTCQTPTREGEPIGAACDEDRGLYCANDFCLFEVCTALCDPAAAPEESPCPGDWYCFRDFDIGVLLDVCVPPYCETDRDCGPAHTCVLAYEFNSETVLRGVCLATDGAQAQPGELCSDERPCQGATCYDDDDGSGFCAGLCDDDADCGPGAICDVVNFGIPVEPGRAPAQICVPGRRTGSGRVCEVDADCPVTPEHPAESCAYHVIGEIESGRFVEPPQLAGRCAEIPAGAVAPGESCSDARPCRTESLCLSAGDESFCSAACRRSRDCAEGMLCFAIDFGGGQGGVCVPADLFETGGSADPCQSDDDCRQDFESCQLRIITADRPQAERVCLWAPGDGPAGADCEAPTDCFSGDCHPRDGDGGDGYCRAPCRADRDCGDGFTCEAVVPVPGVDPIDLCQPIEALP